jgi:hypothetical protein
MTANGSGFGEVAEIEAQMFSFAQMFNRRTSAAITPIPCYRFALLVCMLFVGSFGLSWCVGWWLFYIFCLALSLGKNANVPPMRWLNVSFVSKSLLMLLSLFLNLWP